MVDHSVSVEKLLSRRLTLYILSALYRLANGSIAERVPRCVVARSVAFALVGPMQNLSANRPADIFWCRSPDTKVLLAGMSSGFLTLMLAIILSFMHVRDDDI